FHNKNTPKVRFFYLTFGVQFILLITFLGIPEKFYYISIFFKDFMLVVKSLKKLERMNCKC
ncbi:MAG: hypothetical protein ACLTHN_02725, partial [Streptococcus thermophilus]